MDKIRKLTNISEVQVPVKLIDGNTIYVPPKGVIENICVENYYSIKRFVKAEIDLSEVSPFGGKQYLKG
jgi:hypothetical protein